MITLIIMATLGGGCQASSGYGYASYAPSYGYRQTYVSYGAAPTYYTPTYQAPVQYQAPQVDYKAVVGEYLREEYRQKAAEEQAAKLARIETMLLQMKQAPQPAPQPQPQPQPEFQAPYPSPQTPSKAPPTFEAPAPPAKATPQQFQSQPSQQYPSQQWSPTADQPSYPSKPSPSPSPSPPFPSFEATSWVPPPTANGGGAGRAVAAMTSVFQTRCVDCHVGTSDKGGGVKLLEIDGSLADITPYLGDSEGGIAKAVISGRMPKKGPKLNDRELYTVLSGLREYEATSRARQNVVASFGQ